MQMYTTTSAGRGHDPRHSALGLPVGTQATGGAIATRAHALSAVRRRFLVLEYVEGGEMFDYLVRSGRCVHTQNSLQLEQCQTRVYSSRASAATAAAVTSSRVPSESHPAASRLDDALRSAAGQVTAWIEPRKGSS